MSIQSIRLSQQQQLSNSSKQAHTAASVPVGGSCSFSPSVGPLAVCRWCNSSTPVSTSSFYKGTIHEAPTFFMFCIHCKHCSDDVYCLPASYSGETVDEYRDQLHEHYEEQVEGTTIKEPSAADVIPPVVTVPEVSDAAVGPPAPHEELRVRTRVKTQPSLKYIISVPDKTKLTKLSVDRCKHC